LYNKQVLLELYDTTFGICDHVNEINPLSSVTFHKGENYYKDYLYDNYLATFIYREIGKKLNITFDQFIDRPLAEIQSIMRIVEEIDKRKLKANETLLKDLEKERPKSSNSNN